MNYKVIATPRFLKDIKFLAKKYPSLKSEIAELLNTLKVNPEQGTPIGHHCYKIRLAIASKGKGKSGGARVITFIRIVSTSVFLLAIYDKSARENISVEELLAILKMIP